MPQTEPLGRPAGASDVLPNGSPVGVSDGMSDDSSDGLPKGSLVALSDGASDVLSDGLGSSDGLSSAPGDGDSTHSSVLSPEETGADGQEDGFAGLSSFRLNMITPAVATPRSRTRRA